MDKSKILNKINLFCQFAEIETTQVYVAGLAADCIRGNDFSAEEIELYTDAKTMKLIAKNKFFTRRDSYGDKDTYCLHTAYLDNITIEEGNETDFQTIDDIRLLARDKDELLMKGKRNENWIF